MEELTHAYFARTWPIPVKIRWTEIKGGLIPIELATDPHGHTQTNTDKRPYPLVNTPADKLSVLLGRVLFLPCHVGKAKCLCVSSEHSERVANFHLRG